MRGPIDFVVVGFDNNRFDGSILQSLEEPIQNGTIALLGLAVISKDMYGNVVEVSMADTGDDTLIHFTERHMSEDLVHKDDIDEIAELLDEGTSAGVLFIEHLWAKPLKEAIINRGGFPIIEGRIHPDAAEELE